MERTVATDGSSQNENISSSLNSKTTSTNNTAKTTLFTASPIHKKNRFYEFFWTNNPKIYNQLLSPYKDLYNFQIFERVICFIILLSLLVYDPIVHESLSIFKTFGVWWAIVSWVSFGLLIVHTGLNLNKMHKDKNLILKGKLWKTILVIYSLSISWSISNLIIFWPWFYNDASSVTEIKGITFVLINHLPAVFLNNRIYDELLVILQKSHCYYIYFYLNIFII